MLKPKLLKGEDFPRMPLQKRSVKRRQELLSAALELFHQFGYQRTSIDMIASRAGVPVGSFYQYFRTKKQVLLVLMDQLLSVLDEMTLSPKIEESTQRSILGMLEQVFSREITYLGAYRAWREAILTDPDLESKHKAIQKWTTERVRSVVQKIGRFPGAREDIEIEGLAIVLDSLFWDLLQRAQNAREPQKRQLIDSTAHIVYHALFQDHSMKN